MATRGDIRDAVYSEMQKVAGTYDVTDADGNVVDTTELTADNITLRHKEEFETEPQIVYHDTYTRIVYNGTGAGPDMIEYNPDGTVAAEVWREYIEAQFLIDVRASSEAAKEPIYEALRSRLGQYEHTPWPEADVHPDITDIFVADARTVDTGDIESAIRGDQLEVRVEFHRDYTFSTDNIEAVNTGIDVDNDGTIDYTYQTT